MESRVPVGRVAEVFGPVTAPMYQLKCAVGEGELAPGMMLFSVAPFASQVNPRELQTKVATLHLEPVANPLQVPSFLRRSAPAGL